MMRDDGAAEENIQSYYGSVAMQCMYDFVFCMSLKMVFVGAISRSAGI